MKAGAIKPITRIILVLYMLSVILLCFINFGDGVDISSDIFGIPADKAVHFLMFFPFPILSVMSFHKDTWSKGRFTLFMTAVLVTGAIAGGTIELLQGMSAYRSCDIGDFRADCIGLLSGAVIIFAIKTCTTVKSKIRK